MGRNVIHCAMVTACLGLAACASPTKTARPAATSVAIARSTPAKKAIHVREGGLDAALADARRTHRPVFVDLWASWCPPCMAMRTSAFDDPKLQALADDVVWVSIDVETPEGGEATDRWNVHGLPTVLVLDPDAPLPRARWTGPLAGLEIAELLQAASTNPLPEAASDLFGPAPVLRNDDETGRGARARADETLAHLPASSPLAPFLVRELVMGARDRGELARCTGLADAWSDRLPAVNLTVNIALTGVECAEKVTPKRSEISRRLRARAEGIAEDLDASILPLQRGYSLFALRTLHIKEGDAAGAERIRRLWWTFLQGEWARSDVARRNALAFPMEFWLDVQGELGGAADALATISHESPDDVDALRRWAAALGTAKRVDEGIAAIEHGLSDIPEERRLPVLAQEAELYQTKKDATAEARILDAALRLPRPAHESPHLTSLRDDLTKRRRELASPPEGAKAAREE